MNRFPGPPAGPSSPAPPRNPMPLPRPAPPPPPRPTRMSDRTLLLTAAALLAMGLLLLSPLHYFAPVLLLAALPTRQWRAAALDSTNVPPVTPARRHRRLRDAPAGAAVSGRARQPHQAPAVAAQGWTSAAG